MKVKNEYTASLKAPSRYSPNDFTATSAAVFYIVLVALFFALPYIVRATGLGTIINELAKRDYTAALAIDIIFSQAVIISAGIIFSLIMRTNPVSGGGYVCRFDFTAMLFGCLLIGGIQICFSPLHAEFSAGASSFGIPNVADTSAMTGGILSSALCLVLVPVLPCICEELVFRGILMRGMRKMGMFGSVVISAAMFSLFHGNPSQLLLQFIGGMAIGAAVYITGNFAVGMAMHFFNNVFAVGYALEETLYSLSPTMRSAFAVASAISGVAMLVVGLHYFAKRWKGDFEGEPALAKYRGYPVLMSCERRARFSSIIIDSSRIREFEKYYPDAMRYRRGGFVTVNRDGKSPAAAILVAAGLVLALASVILGQFGF